MILTVPEEHPVLDWLVCHNNIVSLLLEPRNVFCEEGTLETVRREQGQQDLKWTKYVIEIYLNRTAL